MNGAEEDPRVLVCPCPQSAGSVFVWQRMLGLCLFPLLGYVCSVLRGLQYCTFLAVIGNQSFSWWRACVLGQLG